MIEAPPMQPDLPEDREATLLAGLKQYQLVAAERDQLKAQVWQLKSDIAAHKVAAEASAAIMNDNDSRMQSAFLQRDAKIAEAAKFKTICTLIAAVLREHDIESAPVIKETEG